LNVEADNSKSVAQLKEELQQLVLLLASKDVTRKEIVDLARGAYNKGNCSVDGCERPARTGGLCSACYQYFRRHGTLVRIRRRASNRSVGTCPHKTNKGMKI